ncbi:arylsulfatase A family protein [Vallitalea longa]|uniref:Arylsulfatase A family protein n=1 Tax=Vallitalea longa TaxID=2936439 RepID=A0A9W5YBC2_9FIRM|nr:sulfatase-like hydrolase/transferase [Vallitalea longa]GKX29366.1 arylsulfatase A family protein [Vallitalea longa]
MTDNNILSRTVCKNTRKPNIIFILSDDQGAWAMRCAGNKEIYTPNLDELSNTGIRFDNFFCTSPVCSPARASILTGKIPSQHGVHDWLNEGKNEENTREYMKEQLTYVDILKENGYNCGISGKWHLGESKKVQKGFSYWNVILSGGGPYINTPMYYDGEIKEDERYLTDRITDGAIDFIKDYYSRDNPFYLSVHYTAPHGPWNNEQHPKKWIDYYRDCKFESCPKEKMHPWQINTATYGYTDEDREEILRGYYGAVSAMDENIGRILEKLDELEIRKETLIIFTSDNGMNMGHHGIYGKGNGTFPQNMYDTSVKVPFIMSHPDKIPQNKVNNQMLSHYDIIHTLIDYIGLDYKLSELPGKSFYPILEGKEMDCNDNVVIYDEYGPVRMIRNKEWKYIHRYPYGPFEFYNLENDPMEKNNLYDNELYKDKIHKLKSELEEWFLKYVDNKIDGAKEQVYGKGQIDYAGVLANGAKNYADDYWFLKSKQ